VTVTVTVTVIGHFFQETPVKKRKPGKRRRIISPVFFGENFYEDYS